MQAAAEPVPWLDELPAGIVAFANSIGSLVYNFYAGAVQLFGGPVRVPFGSNVRVESSTLAIGDGVVVPADWYFPESDEPTGLIYFQHGFLATAAFYSATAAYLAEKTNSIVVAPTLTWNIFDSANYPLMLPETARAIADLFSGDRAALSSSAHDAGWAGELPSRLVLAGHSAGGGLVTGAARYMSELGITDDLAGVVMFDGVGYLDYMSLDLAKIPLSIPVYNLAGNPDTWNIYGDTIVRLAQARPEMFTGVSGCRRQTYGFNARAPDPIIQFAAYLAIGWSSPSSVTVNQIFASGWINDMFNGTHTEDLYGAAGTRSDGSRRLGMTGERCSSCHRPCELNYVEKLYVCVLNSTSTLRLDHEPARGPERSSRRPAAC